MVNGELKTINEKYDHLKWTFVSLVRKIAALCLDGSILLNNERFLDDLNKAKSFL